MVEYTACDYQIGPFVPKSASTLLLGSYICWRGISISKIRYVVGPDKEVLFA